MIDDSDQKTHDLAKRRGQRGLEEVIEGMGQSCSHVGKLGQTQKSMNDEWQHGLAERNFGVAKRQASDEDALFIMLGKKVEQPGDESRDPQRILEI